jgi:hypothetical protein
LGYIKLYGGGFYKRTLRITTEVFNRLEADFLDFQRDDIGGTFAYDCESFQEGGGTFPTRLIINIKDIAFIA